MYRALSMFHLASCSCSQSLSPFWLSYLYLAGACIHLWHTAGSSKQLRQQDLTTPQAKKVNVGACVRVHVGV